jgi:outer membrane protein TolC
MIKNVAKARYANNAGAYVEFLNAQVAQSTAEADQFALDRQLQVALGGINALIGRHSREQLVLRGDARLTLNVVPSLLELEDYAESSHPLLKSSASQESLLAGFSGNWIFVHAARSVCREQWRFVLSA